MTEPRVLHPLPEVSEATMETIVIFGAIGLGILFLYLVSRWFRPK